LARLSHGYSSGSEPPPSRSVECRTDTLGPEPNPVADGLLHMGSQPNTAEV
ncbi:hypothetical protein CEXT_457241, partial [Caerostris extrusa]